MLGNKFMLRVIASEIAKQLDKDVPKFDLIYNDIKHDTTFRVYDITNHISELHGYEDSSKLSSMVKGLAEMKLKKNTQTLDLVIIHYDENVDENNFADIYFTENGQRHTIKYIY